MAYKLQLKRGASGSLPTGSAGEPLFTTDTNDLYIGTGASNQRFQKYIASGTSAQFLKGDGSLDSNTYQAALNGTGFVKISGTTISYDNTSYLPLTGGTLSSASSAETLRLINTGTGYGLYNQSDSYFQGDVKFQSVSNTILKVDASNKLIAAVAGTDYQAPITNPVTGTGTTNYLPKWTSGSAIGNSLVFDDGTNIGVGTASPVSIGTGYTALTVLGSNGGGFSFGTSANKGYIYTDARLNIQSGNFPIAFLPNGVEKMRITDGGNLLVGTTTDSGEKLQVVGAAGNIVKITDGTSHMQFYCGSGLNEISTVSPLLLSVGGTERFRIASTGAATFSSSVTAGGFYTPGFVVPTSAKAVFNNVNYSGPAWNNASFVTGNGATGVMMGGDAATYTYGWIQGVQTDNGANKGLYLNPLGASVFVGGNLLVGTTTDSGERLQVSGGAYFSGSVGIGVAAASKLSIKNGASQLDVNTTASSVTLEAIDRVNTSNSINFEYYARYGSHVFYSGSYTERMRIKSDGKINFSSLPTSATGLSAGDIWNDGGTLKIV